jgi:uncharacterized lipoprotein YehR (DUF1307 family)
MLRIISISVIMLDTCNIGTDSEQEQCVALGKNQMKIALELYYKPNYLVSFTKNKVFAYQILGWHDFGWTAKLFTYVQ